jgi:hypothetical protein
LDNLPETLRNTTERFGLKIVQETENNQCFQWALGEMGNPLRKTLSERKHPKTVAGTDT